MAVNLPEIPTDRVIWITYSHPTDLDRAVAAAPSSAPAVIYQRATGPWNPSAMVSSSLDEMEVVANQLFPAWLPEAEGVKTSASAAPAAVRALALTHAAATGQYGPFLADLAAGALLGNGKYTRRHQPEVRALGLARVLATSFGRSACVLLLRPPHDLDEDRAVTLVRAAQWLVDHGRLAVWICGGSLPAADGLPEVALSESVREASDVLREPEPASNPHSRPVANRRPPRQPASRGRRRHNRGKPHPTSRAEMVLEAALASRPWAAGRAWNHTVRPGPLVNPVRVDLLWQRERCIVEIDGDDHRSAGKYAEDRNRDVMLQLNGYAVLRFTNTQVLYDIESVLALLQQFLATRRRARKGN